ncbi:MAG: zinc ABC transporter substrate-binding protein [Lachnospiraceae bacterium]|nr:zinc ABC transporter substrate-binding protein [Lachnospiraceae bacterium]
MGYWKRIFVSLLSVSLMFCLSGCGIAEEKKDDGRLKVVATVFAEYDFLRNIAGDAVNLSMLMMPGADLHAFDPTPKDIMEVQEADLFVTIGGESDAWSEKIIDSIDNNKLQAVRLMDCVDHVVEEELVEGMEAEDDEDGHEEEKEFDEHVWTSPKNAVQIVEKLRDKLCRMDEANAELYQDNAKSYIKKLQKLDEAFTELVQNAKRREIIVADRFPFRYFADAYGLKYYAAFPGCSTQTGASVETIAFLIRKAKEDDIPVVFHMEMSSEAMCNTICDEAGAKKAQLNAVHNISRQDFNKGIGYLELMKENIEVLKEALY